MSNWMKKAIEDLEAWSASAGERARKEQEKQQRIDDRRPAFWSGLVELLSRDVEEFDKWTAGRWGHIERVVSSDTDGVGFVRGNGFPIIDVWLTSKRTGIECRVTIAKDKSSQSFPRTRFFEYGEDENGKLCLTESDRCLTEDRLIEAFLGPLVFPNGRPPIG
jgi:hypothetical protein